MAKFGKSADFFSPQTLCISRYLHDHFENEKLFFFDTLTISRRSAYIVNKYRQKMKRIL